MQKIEQKRRLGQLTAEEIIVIAEKNNVTTTQIYQILSDVYICTTFLTPEQSKINLNSRKK